jgi:hypothetical protein
MLRGLSMPSTRVRFTIGRLMIVVAVAGILSALLRTAEARALAVASMLILGPLPIAYLYPFYSRPGRRLLAATWVAALWPLSIPWTLHVAWGVAYGFLGHSPGPADNGPVLEFLTGSVCLSILLSLFSPIFCLLLPLYLTDEQIAEGDRWDGRAIPVLYGFLSMPLVWFSVMVVGRWDPLKAGVWFMD